MWPGAAPFAGRPTHPARAAGVQLSRTRLRAPSCDRGAALPRRRRRPGRHGLRPAAPQLADNASDRFTAACTGHREPPLGDRVLRGDGDGTLLWSTRSADPATSIRGTPCREARIEHTRAPRRGPEASGQGARHARSLRRSSSRHSIVAERPRGLLVLVALARRLVLSLLDDA